MSTLAEDRWLAGFADGEGCFQILGAANHYAPRFRIVLRDDDADILFELHREFGGSLGSRRKPNAASRPQIEWRVIDKRSLQRLVDYFDRFPLRAKKQRDYAIWRAAVISYSANEPCERRAALKSDLQSVRAYPLAAVG
jgi:hypothetical protein